jgi:hypothetical protein
MTFHFGGIAARLKSMFPLALARPPRDRDAGARQNSDSLAEFPCQMIGPAGAIRGLSAETEAALAPLHLPPDGPIDATVNLRARLAADVAARNFVTWARALGLAGHYSKQSLYALYCEFSEVDHRPPLRDHQFLQALTRVDGIVRQRLRRDGDDGKLKWAQRWTIEPPRAAPAGEAAVEETAPGAVRPNDTAKGVEAGAEPAAKAAPSASSAASAQRLRIVIGRFDEDADHPFSPAGLRERQKHARRVRLNAAARRKQRGALRRAA